MDSGGLFTWYRMIDINFHNFNSFLLLTVFMKFCTVYIFGFINSTTIILYPMFVYTRFPNPMFDV